MILTFADIDDPVLFGSRARLDGVVLSVPGYVDSTGLSTRRSAPLARFRVTLKISPVRAWSFSAEGGNGTLIPESVTIDDQQVTITGVIPARLVAETPSEARVWFDLDDEPYESRRLGRWVLHRSGDEVSMEQHKRILREMIALGPDFDETAATSRALGWNGRFDLVKLTANDARLVLERFLAGEIGIDRLSSWADALEGREDVELDQDAPADLASLLFELSTPEINDVSTESIRQWVGRLSRHGR